MKQQKIEKSKEGIFYSKEFEAAVLGACMLEKDAFARMYDLIDADTFYFEDNKILFTEMNRHFKSSLPIDMLTMTESLMQHEQKLFCCTASVNTWGSIAHYITKLCNDVCSSAHLEYHCYLLKKMWRKRQLEKLTHSGFDAAEDELNQIREITNKLQDIAGDEIKQDWFTMDELMFNLIMHQEKIRRGEINFLTTGFSRVDEKNGGFSAGNLIAIGARPGVGKSALMNSMARKMAKQGKKVGIVSLEMNNVEIAARLAALETNFSFEIIHRNLFIDENQRDKFYQIVSSETNNLPIYVSDKTRVDIAAIRSKAYKLQYKHGCDCLMIDYLQLVDSTHENRNINREQEVARISRGLKVLAHEMKIPVIVLCQLNREVNKRKGDQRYPQLSDLRESGAIEQDSDVVFMLHKDWEVGILADENGHSTEFEADLIGVKWRNGKKFKLKLAFDGPRMRFSQKGDVADYRQDGDDDTPF